jgi:uncharacterized protein YaaN involved in tellurite resistance
MEKKLEKQLENPIQKDENVKNLISDEDMNQITEDVEKTLHRFDSQKDESIDKLLEELGDLGEKEQARAGDSLHGLRRPVKDLMGDRHNEVPENLLKLRNHVKELDPTLLNQKGIKGLFSKMLRKSPADKYIQKYQSVETNIEKIIEGLLIGRDRLQEDNADLKLIKEDAEEKIKALQRQILYGERVSERLDNEKLNERWKNKEHIINEAQAKILIRTQNMAVQVNVLQQSLASVDLIRKDNEKLKEAIRNAITTTKNVAPVTAMIHLALKNQTKVMNAVKNVNQTTEDMILANAKMLKENTEETTRMLENSSLDIDKLQQAFNDVYTAIQAQEQSTRRIIDTTKERLGKIKRSNQDIQKKLFE